MKDPDLRISAALAPATLHSYPYPWQAFVETDGMKSQSGMLTVVFLNEFMV